MPDVPRVDIASSFDVKYGGLADALRTAPQEVKDALRLVREWEYDTFLIASSTGGWDVLAPEARHWCRVLNSERPVRHVVGVRLLASLLELVKEGNRAT